MPEDLKVDCFDCKDLEFARNLAKSMRDGYGRHNSNRAFRDMPSMIDHYVQVFQGREIPQARVIGRIRDRAIRDRWQDCDVGDAVPEEKVPDLKNRGHNIVCIIKNKTVPIHYWPEGRQITVDELPYYDRFTFERVVTNLHDADGLEHRTAFWKRLS